MQSAGVKFASTANDSPASAAGLDGIITSMDGVTINNIYDLSAQLARINPHDNVTITTTTGTFHMTTGTNPANQSLAYLGISDVTNAYKYRVFGGYVPNAIISIISAWDGLLFWILLISSGVGIVNMLPIMPLDGGRMYQEIFKKFFKRKANIISKIVSLAVLFVILFDIIGVWLLKTLA
ncbi:RIP metalloprotease [archaeon]|nr:MAG: RIP metalloprotease [archaeon]